MTISATTQGIKPGVCLSTSRPVNPFDGQVIYMTDVDQTAVWDGTQWTVLAPIAGGRNRIINGNMNVWQRSTDATTTGTDQYANVDRWKNRTSTGTGSMRVSRQLSGLAGTTYCARVQRVSGNTSTSSLQMINIMETIQTLPLAGQTVTVSFYARKGADYSSSGSGLTMNLTSGTGTDQSWISFTNGTNIISDTKTLTSSWTRYSSTVTVASNVTQLYLMFTFDWVGTAGANDYYAITGVQLEAGAVATPFEFEDFSQTLRKCQRYFYRTFCHYLLGAVRDTNLPYFTKQFPVTMRVAPTFSSNYTTRAVTAAAAAGEVGFYGNGWYSGSGATSVSLDSGDTDQESFYFTGWTGTAGQNLALISSPYTFFSFSSEL